ERRRLEITRALVTTPKFLLLDEPFAGVDPIAVHDIQTIVAGLRHKGIGVLITDHNVEQTLDIVDRAYIMFEGKVQVSGTVREQVQMLDLTPRQHLLAEEFLGNIGEDGYLQAPLEEIVRGVNQVLHEHADKIEGDVEVPEYTLQDAEAILRIIQSLDPPGVGARDLRECLLLQLEQQKRQDTLAYRLVKEAWDDLKAHRWSELGKRFGLEAEEVQKAADEIRKLDPKPG